MCLPPGAQHLCSAVPQDNDLTMSVILSILGKCGTLSVKSSWSLWLGIIQLEVDLHRHILAQSHKTEKPNESYLILLVKGS